ncbi:hypothetical protein [Mucilaginibacter sp. SP1R1]|nr:hypothetical protein [Mucilaginibacter sp. SP1R1]MBB6148319.1 hypothetical protein [Mucilaginibacter sp. SP1R1]
MNKLFIKLQEIMIIVILKTSGYFLTRVFPLTLRINESDLLFHHHFPGIA